MQFTPSRQVNDELRRPFDIVLQWHITERCNLRCTHCYQEDYSTAELPFQDLLEVVEQFKDLLSQLDKEKNTFQIRGHINISGGEPFIRSDFLDLLEVFAENKKWFTFGILTNGTLIDAAIASRLRRLGVSFVQVSIEGSKSTNDEIRGPGVFEKIVIALRHLQHEEINSWISFTAHRKNFREFAEVARLGQQLGVQRVWSDRLIPSGSGATIKNQLLSPEETRNFFEIMFDAQSETVSSFSQTTISMHRALQFLVGGGSPYRCGAGNTLVTIQSMVI